MSNSQESIVPVIKSRKETKQELDRGEVKEYLRLKTAQEYLTLLEQNLDRMPDTQVESALQLLKRMDSLNLFIKNKLGFSPETK